MTEITASPYEALLLVSFGGPEGMDDVLPFMENVLRGRNVPRERMIEVSHHYELFNGISPLNAQNRTLIAALEADFKENGLDLPIYWGNRNWTPYLTETIQQMADDGIKKALALFTSAYSSYSSCRQYRENIIAAQETVGMDAPQIDKLRVFYNHPGFIEPQTALAQATLNQIPAERRAQAHIAFTAHSIPNSMAANSRYEAQLQEASRLVAEGLNWTNWELVYQSRSGPPHVPWLEPDICDHIAALHAAGTTDIVMVPIGFLSDHMEVIYDLDTEAQQLADELGVNLLRAQTVGTHPNFVKMVRELVLERMTTNPTRRSLGDHGPSYDVCPIDCCLPGGRPTGQRPSSGRPPHPLAKEGA